LQWSAAAALAAGGRGQARATEGPSGSAADAASGPEPKALSCDVFVYGSTPGGLAAAVEAARRGERVLLACPKKHVGGMAAAGLCTTDAVRKHLFGGFVMEFIGAVRAHYIKTLGTDHPDWRRCRDGWFYEPSVAEACFRTIVERQERLEWMPGCWLTAATVEAGRITAVELDGPDHRPIRVTARTYIDCTYEGDLADKAGVPSRVAREGREEFGEPRAGIHYMNWRTGKQIDTPQSGEPSIAIQAYCARSIVTDDPDHRIPLDKPATYEQHLQDYVPVIGDFKSGRVKRIGQVFPLRRMPNRRYEVNGNIESLTSPNCPGVSWAYPTADRHMRAELDKFHVDHAAGLLYFLQHDPHVPDDIAARARQMGLHDQEFTDSGHWPWQIYVRQARRIEGRAIVTQNSFTPDPKTGRTPTVPDPIALGEHSFDVHPCHDRRWMVDGFMEGVLWYPRKAEGPAQPGQIPYGVMLPKHVDNLLVPVAMSSTHIAMSVLRMEPVWMTTGQVAGLAAAVAHEQSTDVVRLDPRPLPKTLGIRTDLTSKS